MTDQPDTLRQRIHDLLNADGEFIGCPAATADAVLAVVQPPLDKATTRGDIWKAKAIEMEADRDRLAAAVQRARNLLPERPEDDTAAGWLPPSRVRAALDAPDVPAEETPPPTEPPCGYCGCTTPASKCTTCNHDAPAPAAEWLARFAVTCVDIRTCGHQHHAPAAPAANRPAELSDTERQFLTYALDLATDQMASRSNEFSDEDTAALETLRRMATGPAPDAGQSQDDDQPQDAPAAPAAPRRHAHVSAHPAGYTIAVYLPPEAPDAEVQRVFDGIGEVWATAQGPEGDDWDAHMVGLAGDPLDLDGQDAQPAAPAAEPITCGPECSEGHTYSGRCGAAPTVPAGDECRCCGKDTAACLCEPDADGTCVCAQAKTPAEEPQDVAALTASLRAAKDQMVGIRDTILAARAQLAASACCGSHIGHYPGCQANQAPAAEPLLSQACFRRDCAACPGCVECTCHHLTTADTEETP